MSVKGLPISGVRSLNIFVAWSVNLRIFISLSRKSVAISVLFSKFFISSLARTKSLSLLWSSALTVCNSSFRLCISSLDVVSSSFVDCNSSFVDCSSSLVDWSSSCDVCISSRALCTSS